MTKLFSMLLMSITAVPAAFAQAEGEAPAPQATVWNLAAVPSGDALATAAG